MPKFSYVALDARGQESVGVIDANSTNDAVAQLRSAGYFPTSVVEEGKGGARAAGRKVAVKEDASVAAKRGPTLFQRKTVKGKVLMIFTRQLATLIDAGLPLLRGLTVLAKQEKDPVLKNTINMLADSVQGGSTFSDSLAQHPKIFNKLYVNMVKAGELGGVLELVLNRLAEFQEKAQKIKNKVVSAMFYPGKQLPTLTRFVMGISDFVQNNIFIILGGAVLVIVGYNLFARTTSGRAIVDRVKLHMPLFGDLVRKSSISRFSRTLGTLVTSGVPILQALNITRETAGNTVIADAILKVHDSVKEGESIVQPLEASGVFPPMVISMIDVGEETGQLPEMLLKIAEVYDDEVDNAVAGLTSLLEPIMIVFLAVVVGTIVIALFLPLISIITGMNAQAG
jgi:type IV pilus assembly protein PilC